MLVGYVISGNGLQSYPVDVIWKLTCSKCVGLLDSVTTVSHVILSSLLARTFTVFLWSDRCIFWIFGGSIRSTLDFCWSNHITDTAACARLVGWARQQDTRDKVIHEDQRFEDNDTKEQDKHESQLGILFYRPSFGQSGAWEPTFFSHDNGCTQAAYLREEEIPLSV